MPEWAKFEDSPLRGFTENLNNLSDRFSAAEWRKRLGDLSLNSAPKGQLSVDIWPYGVVPVSYLLASVGPSSDGPPGPEPSGRCCYFRHFKHILGSAPLLSMFSGKFGKNESKV